MKAFRAAMCAMLAVAAALLPPGIALGQDPAAPAAPPAAESAQYSADELEQLIGPIALYPDDLLAIILPASTYPLDVVKAQRFLEKHKIDSNLQPDPALPEPVRNLLNYPEVIKKMNDDLDWVQALGEAVVSQQSGVMDAIQKFRRKASAAGSLKTDDKQIVVVEKEVIKVVPADPEVVYVPQYQPSTVVVQSAPPAYYPTPYPCYYYPYAPGAAFATGLSSVRPPHGRSIGVARTSRTTSTSIAPITSTSIVATRNIKTPRIELGKRVRSAPKIPLQAVAAARAGARTSNRDR